MRPILRKNLSADAADALCRYIQDMDLSVNTKLPPEAELAAELGVSRVTIRRSLDELEHRGIVLRIHGRGTFVNPAGVHIRTDLSKLLEFGEVIQRSGHASEMEVLEVNKRTAVLPGKKSAEQIIEVKKLYYADHEPAILSVAQIPASVFAKAPEDGEWALHSNFELLYTCAGRIIPRDRIEIATYTTAELVEALPAMERFSCASVLALSGCGYDQDNQPVIFGTAYYNTELVQFNIIRQQ